MSQTNEEKHKETYETAEAAVRALDPAEIAERTGISWIPETGGKSDGGAEDEGGTSGHLDIPALGHTATIEWPALEFQADHPLLKTFPWKLICLHHLALTPITRPVHEWISYRQIPDGLFYAQAVTRDVERPLAAAYAHDLAAFAEAGFELGGGREPVADVGMVFWPLPLVPVLFALWAEDEEFGAEVKVLYDRGGAGNLPLQDLRIIAELIGGALQDMAPGDTA